MDEERKKNGEEVNREGKAAPGNRGNRIKTVILMIIAAGLLLVMANSHIFTRSSSGNGGRAWGGSCCGSGGGAVTREELTRAGLEYYRANFGEDDVEAVVEDYGCHQEIVIYRDGETVRRLTFANGKIYDITR